MVLSYRLSGKIPIGRGHFINWTDTLTFAYTSANDYLFFCLEELQQHRERTANITRKLRQYCKDHDLMEQINYLRSVVGIGFVTAITLFTDLILYCTTAVT